MTEAAPIPGYGGRASLTTRLNRLIANPEVHRIVNRLPFLRGMARRDGAELFSLVSGFVHSQVLLALVELDILQTLLIGPEEAGDLARACGLPVERMAALLQAGAALGLVRRRRDGRYALGRKGAALLGVPGLQLMVRHHRLFYRDIADPVALLRGETETELARFWPYVSAGEKDESPDAAQAYSQVMAETQALVAEDVLQAVDFRGLTRLMDVGGGTGRFIEAVAASHPDLSFDLVDLPAVIDAAAGRMDRSVTRRTALHKASFRDDPLPRGADGIALIRVLYDHTDATVAALLSKVFGALPPGGRLIVAEPMSGGARPDPAGDVYFAFYTMAMGTGRVRAPARIVEMCRAAGFRQVRMPRAQRPFVTSVVEARKPQKSASSSRSV